MNTLIHARRLFLLTAISIFAAVTLGTAIAAKSVSPVNQTSKGIAVKGYDMVSYFVNGTKAKGDKTITHDWNGATWRFSSEENRDLFAGNPEKYAPQFGGYCAYGVAKGATVSFDPDAWKIVDDKLYLNLSKSIQKKWEKDIPGYIQTANANWPGLLGN